MDISNAREDFPTMRKNDGVYLDSACQSLRPDSVIEAITDYYTDYPGCGGRSVHSMSTSVSIMVDEARERLAEFFGTDDPDSYIFTKNCTEGVNIVANGFGLKSEDVVVTTDAEHNSNHVPWLMLSQDFGVGRRYVPTGKEGMFDVEAFKDLMDSDVKLVSVVHAGNVTGYVNPIKEIVEIAHDHGASVLVDGSQAAPHFKVDLKDLDVDFYSMSVHKLLGPSGMGVLYGKEEALNSLRPLMYGGGTVGLTTYDSVNFAPIPDRFEAGLQNYSGIAGTKAALDYLDKIGMDKVHAHDKELMRKMFSVTEDIETLELVGPQEPDSRCGVFSFNIKGLGSHDVSMMLDKMDHIMVRSGMHCAHPFYKSRCIEGSTRASVYLYNNVEDVERFGKCLTNIADTFGEK